jgi:hypothetical protein
MHPWVVDLSEAIDPDLPPEHAGFSAATMERQRKLLPAKRADRTLFEHLLVLALRCEDKGMLAVCAQLRELGLIGFAPDEQEASLKAAERLHRSAQLGSVGRNNDMAKGLATNSAKFALGGVGLKKPTKKS